MTISIEHYVTGNALGRALAQDNEELAYAIDTLREDVRDPVETGREIGGMLMRKDAEDCATFLRALADGIEAGWKADA